MAASLVWLPGRAIDMSLDWIHEEVEHLANSDLLRKLVTRSGKLGPVIVVDGRRYTNFASNDYLGIAADPTLRQIVDKTVLRGGWGSGASPLIVGRSAIHAELERRLATFLHCEAALLFSSGFACNLGCIPALVGKEDVIFSDQKNHASIIDGCRLSGAKVVVYRHADVGSLAENLNRGSGRRRLIVTDGLFSMDGDLAPLNEIAQLAKAHDAMLMVDEAHALGVIGSGGRGVVHHFELDDRVDVRVGTLSKSFGSHGGFVAGSRALIDYLSNRARSYVFSTAAPAPTAAVALSALNMMRDQPERRERLIAIATQVRESLSADGWNIGRSTSHIIPIVVGEAKQAISLSSDLRDAGLWVPCIRPPSVPDHECMLRIGLSSSHTNAMIGSLLSTLSAIRNR